MGNYALDDEGLAHLVSKLKAYITNKVGVAADEEDTTAVDGKLKLRDRSIADGGRPYIILRKGKTFAQQVTVENAIYEVRYAFDLGGGEVTLPKGALLRFAGGVLSNGRLKGALRIEAGDVKIFDNMRFDVAGSNCVMNVKWFGAKGDYSRTTPNDYTDDTDAIQAAIDTELGVYFPAGRYAVRNLSVKSYTWYEDRDDANSPRRRSKAIYGDDYHTTWLVGVSGNGGDVVSFYGCFSDFYGIYVTTAIGKPYSNGVHFVKHLSYEEDPDQDELLINYSKIDIAAYGDFGVCVNVQESIQYTDFKIICTYDPETNQRGVFTITRPRKGFVLSSDYNIGGSFDLRIEYCQTRGIEFYVKNKCQSRIRFLDEGEMEAGYFSLPGDYNSVYIYDSYTECATDVKHPIMFNSCRNVVVNGGTLWYKLTNCKSMRFVNTKLPEEKSVNCENIVFEDCDNVHYNHGVNFLTAYIDGCMTTGHNQSLNALVNMSPKVNLVTNKFNTGNGISISGEGYDDETRHFGFGHAMKVNGNVAQSVSFDILGFKQAFDYGRWAISAFVKPIGNQTITSARIDINIGRTYKNAVVDFADYAIPLGDGWYFFKLSMERGNWEIDSFDVKCTAEFFFNNSSNESASYYITKAAINIGGGVNYPWVQNAIDSYSMNAPAAEGGASADSFFNRITNNYYKFFKSGSGSISVVGKGMEEDVRLQGYDYSMKVYNDTYMVETYLSGIEEAIDNGFVFSAYIKPINYTPEQFYMFLGIVPSGDNMDLNVNFWVHGKMNANGENMSLPITYSSVGNGWYKVKLVVPKNISAGIAKREGAKYDFGLAIFSAEGERVSYYMTQMAINSGAKPLYPWSPMLGDDSIEIETLKNKIDNTVFESTLSFNVMPSSVIMQVERVTLGNGEQSFRTKRQYEIHLELNAFMGTTKLTQFKTGYKYRFEGLRSWGLHDEMPNISFDDGKGNVTVIPARGYSRNGGPVPEGDDDYYLYEMSQDDGSLTFVVPQGTLCTVDMLDSGYGNQVNSAVFNISVYLIKPDGEEVDIPNFYAQIPITLID